MFATIRRLVILSATFVVLTATSALQPDHRTIRKPVLTGHTVTVIFTGDTSEIDIAYLRLAEAEANTVIRLVDRPDLAPFPAHIPSFHNYCPPDTQPCRIRLRIEGPSQYYMLEAEIVDETANGVFPFASNPAFEEGTSLEIEAEAEAEAEAEE